MNELLNKFLEESFEAMKNRVFNKYSQKDYLIEMVQKLDYRKSFNEEIDPLETFLKKGSFLGAYMGGNQSIKVVIHKVELFSINELLARMQDRGLRLGQIFEQVRYELGGDLFHVNDRQIHEKLIKLYEKIV